MKEFIQKSLMSRGFVLTMAMRYMKRNRRIDIAKYAGDYVRNSSLELVAHEIIANNIQGSVAELGVYRGDFARIVNEAFPDRKLYLFDTFEGFRKQDIIFDKTRDYSAGNQDFSETDVGLVLGKMKTPANCIVEPGYFPESAAGVEDMFAFVSIDADLYKPIYDGLSFFYPKLSKGGYIFVHDYNNDEYKGAGAAVRGYCREMKIAYFPLPDACGSAIICK
jgi:O-methyltransferase